MVSNKKERQAEIKKIITQQKVQKQDELVQILNERGWNVTQATVSRDIASMQLVKVPLARGGFAYDIMHGADYLVQVRAILNEDQTKIKAQNNMVLIQVRPGTGPVLKISLETMDLPEVFGVLGDDSTVLVIVKEGYTGKQLLYQLLQLS
ncbi:arginine catabolic regulator [Weissella koreensis]|uniref:Arginine repressor n=1 Tax=Weissella koreensis TaxID=165096 RepID=A0A7H1MKQ1_9LACO|nr:arginine catabolic regulator [Weissella koreensis]AEJ23190.1 arginine catabolic regulator [Weissella koreensis KACC 15510]AVH74834.1 arginine catabolic regulator [Weissella koreensis]EJF33791.1 hypothetical protein JC2156_06050 [Weissella koreensis KCTC 3621]MCZ9310695.1 arginine catabolic regulator [Weissella koreensis]QGN20058.1 arginine catabolic regulator [Weissella koreensis]